MTGVDRALAVAAKGWRVFPCDGKEALVPWKRLASSNPRAIRQLWRPCPDANVGIALPEGTVVVDIDDLAAFTSTGLVLPDAPGQATPSGGFHRLFSMNGRGVAQTVKATPGMDTRVGGLGYIVAWDVDALPSVGEYPDAPAWLYDDQQSDTTTGVRSSGSSRALDAIRDGHLYIEQGERDDALASIAGTLIAHGASSDATTLVLELLDAAGAIEQPDGDVIDRKDFSRIARSIARSEAKKPAPDDLTIIPLTDIEDRAAQPLRFGRLDPEDHTVLFGDGGTGKGIVAAYDVSRLTREDEIVLILDYERHARYEWKPRIKAFRGDMARVYVAQPLLPIWDVAEQIKERIDALHVTWVFVDSVGYACIGQEIEKSTTAIRYQAAVSLFDRPTVSLAHTTKANADPQHPFGSTYWSNSARVTIGMSGRGDEPRVLRNRKTNQRAVFSPIEVDWSWSQKGVIPPALHEHEKKVTAADRAYMVLLSHEALSRAELLARVNADGGPEVTDHVLRNTLNRWVPERFQKVGDDWALAIRVVTRTRAGTKP